MDNFKTELINHFQRHTEAKKLQDEIMQKGA
jgi:hypothetical protein